MYRSYADTGGNVNEEIKLLNSISHVSARLARNLSILAAQANPGKEEKQMSKMADMAQTIEDPRNAAAAINDAADCLYKQFSGSDESESPEPVKPEPKKELKLEDVRPVLANLSRSGHTAEVRALLQKYGAAKLSLVDPANYEALLKDAEVIANGQ